MVGSRDLLEGTAASRSPAGSGALAGRVRRIGLMGYNARRENAALVCTCSSRRPGRYRAGLL